MSTENSVAVCPKWTPTNIDIVNVDGLVAVPAIVCDLVPGLAVTMSNFGEFVVTHIATGRKIVGPFERWPSAACAAINIGPCADWTLREPDQLAAQIKASADEPCGFSHCMVSSGGTTRPMTKGELYRSRTSWLAIDEFPWEGDEDSPHSYLDRAMDDLFAARQS